MGDFTTAGEVESVTAHEIINKNTQIMSRHQLRLVCGGLDIICVSCYEAVKGEQSPPIALKMPMAVF